MSTFYLVSIEHKPIVVNISLLILFLNVISFYIPCSGFFRNVASINSFKSDRSVPLKEANAQSKVFIGKNFCSFTFLVWWDFIKVTFVFFLHIFYVWTFPPVMNFTFYKCLHNFTAILNFNFQNTVIYCSQQTPNDQLSESQSPKHVRGHIQLQNWAPDVFLVNLTNSNHQIFSVILYFK